MNKFWLFSIAMFLFCLNKVNNGDVNAAPGQSLNDVCSDYNALNTQIRDGLISKKEALKRIQELMPIIKTYYYAHGGRDQQKTAWKFPLQNYGPSAVGGTNGEGYMASGYNFFDGNKHGG